MGLFCIARLRLILAAMFVGWAGNAVAQDSFKWDFITYLGPNQNPVPLYMAFADEVREKTNGRLDITIRPQGELPFQPTEVLRAIYRNQVQIADANTGFVSGDLKIAQIFNMPFLISSRDEFLSAGKVLDPVISQELEPFGADILFKFSWPAQQIWGAGDAPEKLEDLRGVSVRTYAAEQNVFLKRVGAIPVSLSFAEVPGALQRGVVSALMTSGLSVFDAKLFEIVKWGYLINYNLASNYIVVNAEAKNALPDDLEAILHETAAKYQELIMAEIPKRDAAAMGKMQAQGLVAVEPSSDQKQAAAELMSDFWADWAAENDYGTVMQEIRAALHK